MKRPPKDNAGLAKFWSLEVRTIQRLRAGDPPAPLHSVKETVAWFSTLPPATQLKLTRPFVDRIVSFRVELAGGKSLAGDGTAKHEGFEKWKAERAGRPSKDGEALESLKQYRDFMLYEIGEAMIAKDEVRKNAAKMLLKDLSGIVHDEEVRAARLGRETGEMIPRPHAELLARAISYHLLRAADMLIADIAAKVVTASASGPMQPEQARRLIEPLVLSARVVEPFAKSAKVANGVQVPKWWTDALAVGLDDTVEGGAAEFARLCEESPKSP